MKNSKKECILVPCTKEKCECTCCDNIGIEEWIIEYCAFHERMKDHLKKIGIKIKFDKDVIQFSNCSTGKECKFIKYSTNKSIDLRPIDYKIYPYHVDWKEMDFDNKKAQLYFADFDCPLTKKKISKEFNNNVEKVIKRDFSLLFYGMDFDVVFHDFCRYDTFKKKKR
ncbi:MAG: hypothetical protein COT14_03380 [Candidatus Diapherotrites archaeon CG08_land_8_20_14_0_20_30_16]|nr:MAG: hypothetical protein COT14_03380 [Candidatus Diapherotrites archaeon CG08_land_8_20_14_0_20_30_16]